MKYFITYCVMDQRIANTNPFWHACILLSSTPHLNQALQVKHVWGYYPATILSDPNSLFGKLKRSLGFNFDLIGAFGELKREEIRHLDLGRGLHGITFEVTEYQYKKLKNLCQTKITNQMQAYAEARNSLELLDHEPTILELFNEEKKSALLEKRVSRLGRFEFRVTWEGCHVSLNESYTCKTHAVNLLKEVGIQQEFSTAGISNDICAALPRFSGDLEDIYLYSTGPMYQHVSKRTHRVSFFRQWTDKTDKLYWSLPPQSIHYLDNDHCFYALPTSSVKKIKNCISKLQQLEHLILNAKVHTTLFNQQQDLLHCICNLYQSFSTLHTENYLENIEDPTILSAENLFHSMYDAIHHHTDDNPIASLSACLQEDEQIKICEILERAYPFFESTMPILT